MKNRSPFILSQLFFVLIITFSSCKKDSNTTTTTVSSTPVIGLFEISSGTTHRIVIPISKVGTQTVNYDEIFDTGSSGLTIDATNIIPASMITSTGFNIAGDSVVVNGITITSHTATVSYGNKTSSTKEYGNLAYASITIPNNGSAAVTIARVPIFLYYKIVDGNNKTLAAHSGDIFGVGPGLSAASTSIASPFTYYKPVSGITNGFKLGLLKSADFTTGGVYETAIVTLGLTPADLTTSGFIMHPLTIVNPEGYSSNIPATITYGSNTTSGNVLFDTGTPTVTIIEDKAASSTAGNLPASTTVTVTTTKGFTYSYVTTSTDNLTEVENPNVTGDPRTILSIDFFEDNEILTDYTNHQIGLKNN